MNSGGESRSTQMGQEHVFYTDGGGNTGPGTWAYVNTDDMSTVTMGYSADTTNNRMELIAVMEAIKSTPPGSRVMIYSDSGYVVKGFTDPSYLKAWARNDRWVLSNNKPVKNRDLWQQMLLLGIMYDISMKLIPGHDGIEPNELVDGVCTWGLRNMDNRDKPIRYEQEVKVNGRQVRVICPQLKLYNRLELV